MTPNTKAIEAKKALSQLLKLHRKALKDIYYFYNDSAEINTKEYTDNLNTIKMLGITVRDGIDTTNLLDNDEEDI